MQKIALVSCAAKKTDYPTEAQYLYVSSLFKLSLAYAMQHFDQTLILSAKYDLVPLNSLLEPYDVTLNNFNKQERLKWGQEVVKTLPKNAHVHFLAGKNYYESIIPFLTQPYTIHMEGLGIGKRLQYLKENTK